jgi:hypothetical protein
MPIADRNSARQPKNIASVAGSVALRSVVMANSTV